VRLLRRRPPAPQPSLRPAERYLLAGTDEARLLGHGVVGTEHVLLALVANPDGDAARLLGRLGVSRSDVESSPCVAGAGAPQIDGAALAALGVDLDAVRDRLDERFGAGALERTRLGCLGVAPRLKQALAHAVDEAGEEPVRDDHVLLGLLRVRDSLAAHVLGGLGVSADDVEAAVRGR
jgi:ATP-dependent Clp protease ATP-binding subunit ClpA